MKQAVMCMVATPESAAALVSKLRSTDFSNDEIAVLFSKGGGTQESTHEHRTKAPEGAVTNIGLAGGALGLLAEIGALAIPGLGPFIAAGPLMAALSGAVTSITAAFVGMGIREFEAKRYEGKLKAGNILISVHSESPDERERAAKIFEAARAEDISGAK